MIRWAIFLGVFLLIDIYAFQAVRTAFKSRGINLVYILVSVIVLANFIYQLKTADRSEGISTKINMAIGLFLTLYIPKIVILVIMFGEDIIRLPQACYKYFTEGNAAEGNYMPSRRMFVSQIALGLAAIPFASFLYGMIKGKYNFKVLKYTLHFEDLPEAFDGYRITQISDIHSGSFDNKEKVEYAVDLVNQQASNVILFTG
ncbi:MAG TPA: hypothetical protein VKN14_03240, partial [Flavobacteriaceae bacterium]|nr:hypothetical protein [Flavobacteriaceae bacterium]